MRNFYRVIRLALRYRWSFAGTVLSALAVGILWGANIGTIYPFVEVAIRGRTLQQWADDKIDEARRNDIEYGRRAEQLQRGVAYGSRGPGEAAAKRDRPFAVAAAGRAGGRGEVCLDQALDRPLRAQRSL